MTTKNALIGLWAHASIHAGAGSSVDGVDLPIQREGHSDWPCVFGSSVKGALRAKAEDTLGKDNASIAFVFGPDSSSDKASEHAGALLVSDAKLLLLPVRSLTSHFKWVTCPALLQRLVRDAQRLGVKSIQDITLSDIADDVALVAGQNTADLFLEEYRFKAQSHDLSGLIEVINQLTGIAVTDLTEQLVIDNDKKTVKPGALWYEETLPPETVLYFALSAQRARAKDSTLQAEQILACVTQELFGDSPYLQLGGNETVGMGWCKVTLVEA